MLRVCIYKYGAPTELKQDANHAVSNGNCPLWLLASKFWLAL